MWDKSCTTRGGCGVESGKDANGMAQSGEGWKSARNFNSGKATGRLKVAASKTQRPRHNTK